MVLYYIILYYIIPYYLILYHIISYYIALLDTYINIICIEEVYHVLGLKFDRNGVGYSFSTGIINTT